MRHVLKSMFAIAFALGSFPAHSAVFLAVAEGLITSGVDRTGEFGAINRNLNGQSIRLSFTFTLPTPDSMTFDDGTEMGVRGGTAFGPGSVSPLSAIATIDGVSRSFAGRDRGTLYRIDGLGGARGIDEIFFQASDDSTDAFGRRTTERAELRAFSLTNQIMFSRNLQDPLDYRPAAGDVAAGAVTLFEFDMRQGIALRDASAFYRLDRLTIGPLGNGTVPEPATWGMMILGFGFAGGAMRARKRSVRFATAAA